MQVRGNRAGVFILRQHILVFSLRLGTEVTQVYRASRLGGMANIKQLQLHRRRDRERVVKFSAGQSELCGCGVEVLKLGRAKSA